MDIVALLNLGRRYVEPALERPSQAADDNAREKRKRERREDERPARVAAPGRATTGH